MVRSSWGEPTMAMKKVKGPTKTLAKVEQEMVAKALHRVAKEQEIVAKSLQRLAKEPEIVAKALQRVAKEQEMGAESKRWGRKR